jgi:hypothetical protein
MPDIDAAAAAEAAQLLAQIRRDTTRADELLVQLRGSGMSWGDLARLIDPDNPPARSSAQRRIESAQRRLAEQSGQQPA